MQILEIILVIASFATCVLMTFRKWKIPDWYYEKIATDKYWAMFPKNYCELCISFWISVLTILVLLIMGGVALSIYVVMIPCCSAAITMTIIR